MNREGKQPCIVTALRCVIPFAHAGSCWLVVGIMLMAIFLIHLAGLYESLEPEGASLPQIAIYPILVRNLGIFTAHPIPENATLAHVVTLRTRARPPARRRTLSHIHTRIHAHVTSVAHSAPTHPHPDVSEWYFRIVSSSQYCRRLKPASILWRINFTKSTPLPHRIKSPGFSRRGLTYVSSRRCKTSIFAHRIARSRSG